MPRKARGTGTTGQNGTNGADDLDTRTAQLSAQRPPPRASAGGGPSGQLGRRPSRVRPTGDQWNGAVLELRESHLAHGHLAAHALTEVADRLRVSPTSLERQFQEWHQRREASLGDLEIGDDIRHAIAGSLNLRAALVDALRLQPDLDHVLFERAVWRSAGDPELRGLRQRELASRTREWTAIGCGVCNWTHNPQESKPCEPG